MKHEFKIGEVIDLSAKVTSISWIGIGLDGVSVCPDGLNEAVALHAKRYPDAKPKEEREFIVGHIYRLAGGAVVKFNTIWDNGNHGADHITGGPAKMGNGEICDEMFFSGNHNSWRFHADEWAGAVDITDKVR